MKKIHTVIVMLLALLVFSALIACNNHLHDYQWQCTEEYHYRECSCGERTTRGIHVFNNIEHDDTYHWVTCICGKVSNKEEHNFSQIKYDETSHWRECSCGVRIEFEDHEISAEWFDDKNNHWHACECGYLSDKGAHDLGPGEFLKNSSCTEEGSVKYTCSTCNKTYYYILEKKPHYYGTGDECKYCSNPRPRYEYSEDEKYIYFGQYPQTEVKDRNLTNSLTEKAGELPTDENKGKWNDYGYYTGGEVQSYMWYIDIEYDDVKYRGVYFDRYRPTYTNNSAVKDSSYQDENGYYTNTVYWFKFEPIKWRILSTNDSEALIMCDIIIDAQAYQNSYYVDGNNYYTRSEDGERYYANNYVHSSIREWLNTEFYNCAFDEFNKQSILVSYVDNSAKSIGTSNSFSDESTRDHVFLLSNKDCINEEYGFNSLSSVHGSNRQIKTTGYSRAQGLFVEKNDIALLENGWWMTRSPISSSNIIRGVMENGMSNADYFTFMLGGVVPVITIDLSLQ